jgi:hypothetical protein
MANAMIVGLNSFRKAANNTEIRTDVQDEHELSYPVTIRPNITDQNGFEV